MMFRQINDLRMFIDERGKAESESILFIHGFTFDHSMWRQQLVTLSTEYYCIAPDLRGHGGTRQVENVTTGGSVSIDNLADDVIALINEMLPPERKFTVCGLSMGGYIAFALWRKIPNRITRLILADTKATADTPEARARRREQAAKVSAGGAQAISDGMLDSMVAAEHRSSPLAMEVRRMIESTSTQGIVDTLYALADRPDSTDTLATIAVPTLVIVGEQDKVTPVTDAQFMQERLRSKGRLVIVPHAGHVSSLENPEEFNRHLIDFLQ
jgi:3-oxoadipate enol-lactonase